MGLAARPWRSELWRGVAQQATLLIVLLLFSALAGVARADGQGGACVDSTALPACAAHPAARPSPWAWTALTS
eukprot:COSAG04_NODE_447_length_14267_cov_17.958569_7_plen_73_part_00